ncbi:site-specific integrase [Kitasatospora acidiphila]|uniref:Site-specific integrase n=1 Tax=Kitasatospora acidiphila TaxID=2567942 RepID=A0A540W4Q4_9ACTN|nr:site-specific integrase [Kitasatospora acidiphila]TQF03907.1 site-specific integrase [Kitasatospora acidiphila]
MASVIKKCEHTEEQWAKCSHNWVVRYREPGGRAGRQREKSYAHNRTRAAKSFAAKVETDKQEQTYVDPNNGRKLVTEIFKEWAKGGDRENNTRESYDYVFRNAIEPFWKGRTIGPVLPKDVDAWCDWMREELKYETSTAYNRYTVLSAVFNYAIVNRYIVFNPFKGAKGVSRAKARREIQSKIMVPTIEEIRLVAEYIKPEYKALVWVMAGCGLRIGEAAALTKASIDLAGGTLDISKQVARDRDQKPEERRVVGKSKLHVRNLKHKGEDFARSVPLPSFVAAELQAHIQSHELFRAEEYLFPNITRTNFLDRSSWSRAILGPAVEEAQLGHRLKGHWFRHYFASVCLAAGVPVTDLARWLGHASADVVLETYAHLMPDAPARTRAALDAALTAGQGEQPTLTVELAGGADFVLTLPSQRGVSAAQMP